MMKKGLQKFMNRNNLEQRPKTINRTHCVALEIRGIMGLFIFVLPCTYVDLKKLSVL